MDDYFGIFDRDPVYYQLQHLLPGLE